MNAIALVLPITLGLYGAVAVLERFSSIRFKPSPFVRAYFATDVCWYLSTLGIAIATRPLLERLPTSGLSETLASLPFAISLLLAVIVYDLTAFLIHIGLHRSDALWEIHKIHHSSRTLDWLATTRQHAIEGLLRTFVAQAVLLLIGFPVAAAAGVLAVYAGFAALGHSNLRIDLGWAESLFITPRLHRLHHVPETSDHNFGTIFSFWDRMFGCLVARDSSADEQCGVPGEVTTFPQSFAPAFLEPLRRIARRPSPPSPRPVPTASGKP